MDALRSGVLGAVVVGLMSGGNAAANVGGGVDSSEGSEVTRDGSVSQSRELSSERSRTSTVERNLLPFIVDGVASTTVYNESTSCFAARIADGQLDREIVEQELAEKHGENGQLPTDPTASPEAWVLHADEREIYASCAAWGALAMFEPLQGWPFRPDREAEADVLNWVQNRIAAGAATGEVFAVIAQELDDLSDLTAEEYQEAAAEAWRDNAQLWLDVLVATRDDLAEDYISICGSSQCPAPVSLMTRNGYSYQHGPEGAKLTHYSLVMLGDGHIMGERYTSSVSIGNEARMTRQSSDSSTQSTSTGESGGGRAATE